ncbi:Glycosyl-hydrolase 97 C-terminal, oligomerisation [Muriicola jejuensis]|uniref:Glycoside hydrolase family 97 protein n=1 Tax=Muriicola jejuensis TaxID=504488 RepID=A0A6P0UCT1_9FLAO|nr:glycoside hydrolase family 97 protein [Muriicola jejuensis]NER09448.1 glycoside hydrolase family 97 protein [Muriicola jejuensis]SMP08578.1 Glycosyl-hydrolase 97 C-terminal, oligomerisation [Muriicola jejuensis]
MRSPLISRPITILLTTLVIILSGCSNLPDAVLESPNEEIRIAFGLTSEGIPQYEVFYKGSPVILPSTMGFDFKEMPSLRDGLKISEISFNTKDETWPMPWGEQDSVRNLYNEMRIALEETKAPNRKWDIVFRAFDDGIGFRYEFPEQPGMEEILITDENTEFNLTGDHRVWWQPGDWDIYEHLYNETNFSGIDAISKRNDPNLKATYIPENAVNTPVTMKTAEGVYLSFHEADLTDYAGMTLKVDPSNNRMVSELVGSERTGGKAVISAPFNTPWRTIQIADRAGDLIESGLVLNLNDPNAIGDVSYFTPMKYVGIWWEMHLGKSTWDMEGSQSMNTFTKSGEVKPNHGATTENAMRYIDFAAENGIKGLLVEGWNTGWDKWINTDDREGVFDFMTPYADYDFDKVMAYAREKGVEVIMHHETSAAPLTYEKQMPVAYKFMKDNGMNSVKTGYVGKIIPKGEYHHGQWMVEHYHKVLETAAKWKIAINAHEPIKDTGKRRTYPNAIAREGLRGQEFNAWSADGGNPPDHLPTVAFTRMLSGPIDFTPGIFNIKFDEYKPDNQVSTTLAHQLALYVVIYSPIQMLADLPEHYTENGKPHPALQFIRDVGVDWSESHVLDGEVGQFVTIARKERGTGNWFVGGITDEEGRTETVRLDFLDPGKTYKAVLYKDAPDAHWDDNPEAYEITSMDVTSEDRVEVKLAPGGGFALSLMQK